MAEQIEQLETRGYCIIPQVYPQAMIEKGLALTNRIFERCADQVSDNVPYLNRDQALIYNLQSKDAFFNELLFYSETVEEILKGFLNDPWYKGIPQDQPNYILRSFLARSSRDQLPMHIDSFVPYLGPFVFSMQAAIILEDHDEENGCTVVVPGSHLAGAYTTQEAYDEAKPILSKAGDVVMWDSRLWHGTRPNTTSGTRWALIATFSRWWLKQAFDIPRNTPQAIYEQLTDPQKAVFGFCSAPFESESVGIDMKRDYASLPANVSDFR